MREPEKMPYYIFAGLNSTGQWQYRRHLYVSNEVKMPKITKIVFDYFGVDELLAYSPSRKQNIVDARNIAIYFIRNRVDLPLKRIGKFFGGRDHSTVLHAIHTVEGYIQTNREFSKTISRLEKLL